MSDTTPDFEKIQIEFFKKMSSNRKWKIIINFIELQRKLILLGIKSRHPEYSDEEVEYAFKRLLLGDELFKKVYPNGKIVDP